MWKRNTTSVHVVGVDELRRRLLAAVAAIHESSRSIAIRAEFEQERNHVGVARRHRDVQRRFPVTVRVIEQREDRDRDDEMDERHLSLIHI